MVEKNTKAFKEKVPEVVTKCYSCDAPWKYIGTSPDGTKNYECSNSEAHTLHINNNN
jgi:hypothetical protein